MADFAHCEDASALQDYWAFCSEVGLSLQDAVHGTVQLGPTARLLCDSLPGGESRCCLSSACRNLRYVACGLVSQLCMRLDI